MSAADHVLICIHASSDPRTGRVAARSARRCPRRSPSPLLLLSASAAETGRDCRRFRKEAANRACPLPSQEGVPGLGIRELKGRSQAGPPAEADAAARKRTGRAKSPSARPTINLRPIARPATSGYWVVPAGSVSVVSASSAGVVSSAVSARVVSTASAYVPVSAVPAVTSPEGDVSDD